ncbi:hypothetical protein N9A81_01975 [Synechococcus sp. AH-707-M23]|nr:hypothetical protein [Synechococcus sp. AH-707-M23]
MRDGLLIGQTVLLSHAELGIKVLKANRQLDLDQGFGASLDIRLQMDLRGMYFLAKKQALIVKT